MGSGPRESVAARPANRTLTGTRNACSPDVDWAASIEEHLGPCLSLRLPLPWQRLVPVWGLHYRIFPAGRGWRFLQLGCHLSWPF